MIRLFYEIVEIITGDGGHKISEIERQQPKDGIQCKNKKGIRLDN